ncbi:response regulator transcription factor [Noviherbaspirillum galbum]|uniref:Response regulator transcription factor n=1 Tax=Noviherbaspirillum galbum TaxID=2709383 RepID=A0A6B3SZV2_9BURK|nr:response regulator transcription factor [Noviherbaspirillum galbum]NEX64709.1 response regulator transcription factor [Noviherbaspirillum galbum]
MNILLAEDDRMIGESIQVALAGEGMAIAWVRDGTAAENALRTHSFDAILLDLGLPGKDGIDVLKDLRATGDRTPVLVLTARDTVPQRVLGLRSGADDYLVKPFDIEELIARLQAVVRRARGNATVYRNGDVSVNLETRQVFLGEDQVMLSAREWAVLEALLARPGAILSRAQLESRLYGWSGEVESNAVEVYIHGLRKKLGQHFVINVRGLGYMIGKG